MPEKGRQLASAPKVVKPIDKQEHGNIKQNAIKTPLEATKQGHNTTRTTMIWSGGGGIIALIIVLIWYRYYLSKTKSKKREAEFKIHRALHPSRLKIYNANRDFLHFCTTYWTKHCQGMVKGTNDLINRLDSFKDSIKSEGPLNMPSVEGNIKEVIKKTWRLQRFIDRIAILHPPNKDYYDIEDKIHAIIDWFAQQEKEIEKLFEPYLKL